MEMEQLMGLLDKQQATTNEQYKWQYEQAQKRETRMEEIMHRQLQQTETLQTLVVVTAFLFSNILTQGTESLRLGTAMYVPEHMTKDEPKAFIEAFERAALPAQGDK